MLKHFLIVLLLLVFGVILLQIPVLLSPSSLVMASEPNNVTLPPKLIDHLDSATKKKLVNKNLFDEVYELDHFAIYYTIDKVTYPNDALDSHNKAIQIAQELNSAWDFF